MLVWCAVLLFLGITAFLDSIFTFGEIFRTVTSLLFMLVSLGLLVRTSTKIKLAQRENTQAKIQQLEDRIAELTGSRPQKEKVATPS
jgi:positive regulator of sigma E activity